MNASINHSNDQSINKQTSKSNNQYINKSTTQSISQPIQSNRIKSLNRKPISQSIHQVKSIKSFGQQITPSKSKRAEPHQIKTRQTNTQSINQSFNRFFLLPRPNYSFCLHHYSKLAIVTMCLMCKIMTSHSR